MYIKFGYILYSFPSLSPPGVVLSVIDVETHLWRVFFTLSDSEIFSFRYDAVNYLSLFFYERITIGTSDARVEYSRAFLKFCLTFFRKQHTCARYTPVTHRRTPRTRVAEQKVIPMRQRHVHVSRNKRWLFELTWTADQRSRKNSEGSPSPPGRLW